MSDQKENILFVDDEENFLQGLRLMLRGQRPHWNMTFVTSVDAACELIAENDYDAIVSDVRMPGKTGLDFLGILQSDERTADIPVIILTGNAEVDLKRTALDLGAADLLNKPVIAEDLLARLRSILRLRSYQMELKAQNEVLEERVRERTRDLEHSRLDILWRLAKAGEYRDEDTGDHVARVAWVSRILAEELSLPEIEVEKIFMCSPLHDIGKIGIPDGVLLKRGKLSEIERETMEQHCNIGAAILAEPPQSLEKVLKLIAREGMLHEEEILTDPLRETAVTIALSHHERWNGEGYPRRLAGEDIPIEGRIVKVADVYDALRSDRPYKDAFTVDQSIDIMRTEFENHFDPNVFEVFVKRLDECEKIRQDFM